MAIARNLVMIFLFLPSHIFGKAIIMGVNERPKRDMVINLTPVVLPDLLTFKAAFEYRIHRKFHLLFPVEMKWMDYRSVINWGARFFNVKNGSSMPGSWYDNTYVKSYNIDISHFKISTGLGIKFFPLSESMSNAFFAKTSFLAGIERFNAYSAEGIKNGAVFTHVLTLGYTWHNLNGVQLSIEAGEEYTWHTNPIEFIPVLLSGFMPVLQFSLGFSL